MVKIPAFIKKISFDEEKPLQNKDSLGKPDHQHQYELLLKTFAPPRKDWEGKIETTGDKMVEKLLFGVTTLLWKCVLCAETKKEEILGSDEVQLDEIFDKVDKYGPQYIQKEGGKTYVIGKFQQTNTGTVPVR